MVEQMASGMMMELVQVLGPMGFVMWLVHRTTTHTTPKMAKSFEEVIERQRADFKEMLAQQRKDYERLIEVIIQKFDDDPDGGNVVLDMEGNPKALSGRKRR